MSESDKVRLGHVQELEIVELTDQGAFVDAFEFGDLFVPKSQLPRYVNVGDSLRVFLYNDGGRVLATARHPYLELGMVGRLRVTEIDCGTVYLDLGIPKELVVPVSEQRSEFEVGRSVLIYIDMDDQGRLFGTQRFNRYIEDTAPKGIYTRGQRVTAVPLSHTPLGFRVVVDDKWYGLIYKSEKSGEIRLGKRYDGYILNIRDDGKLDITLQEQGRSGIEHAAMEIMKALNAANGFLAFNDRSDPEDIEDFLHMSKGKFKKAIGHLYKKRLISIIEDGIKLTELGYEEIQSRISRPKDEQKD